MVTVILLAGGKSSRMGQDKAKMEGGVERLHSLATQCGVERIITLCGDVSRQSMFEGETWPDPPSCTSLSEILEWAFGRIDGPIQLISCDSFQLERGGMEFLLTCGGGVPLDENGVRQPLLANSPSEWKLSPSKGRVSSLFSNYRSLEVGEFAGQMKNFNTPLD
ncbi:MAG: hypothetical protein OSA21_03215 [Candidatus Poseidoniaceae archaeon]|nr:hypothetical protein [Candidatus Poseidoniaceae archaeon]